MESVLYTYNINSSNVKVQTYDNSIHNIYYIH